MRSWINQAQHAVGIKERLARSLLLAPTQRLTCTQSCISRPSPSTAGSVAEKDTEIKQLQAENEKLSQENEVLKGKVTALENSNKYLTARLAAYDVDMAKIYEITSTYQT